MTGATLLKLMSQSLSIWAIRYYWKTQEPLDVLAVRVRRIGIISCIAFWFLMYEGLHFLPQSREWLKARPVLFAF